MKISDLIYNLLDQKGVGFVKANKILSDLKEILGNNSSEAVLANTLKRHFPDEKIPELLEPRPEVRLDSTFPEVFFVTRFDPEFPDSLKQMGSKCPPILACVGNIDLFKTQKVGFCGSRKASTKGLGIAKDIARQLTRKGVTLVSGYASGIDQAVHYEALKNGGSTIIVLPEGIEKFKIKTYLKEVWNWSEVLVICEFTPNASWSVSRAMQRNGTIVALSEIMILIESKATGGSMDAGYKTLNIGKPLFTPIYQGMPEVASGNDILITKGAIPIRKNPETGQANLTQIDMYLVRNGQASLLFPDL